MNCVLCYINNIYIIKAIDLMPPKKSGKQIEQPQKVPLVLMPIEQIQSYSLLLALAVENKTKCELFDLTLTCLSQLTNYTVSRLQKVRDTKTRTTLICHICPTPSINASGDDIDKLTKMKQLLEQYPSGALAIVLTSGNCIIPFMTNDTIELKELDINQQRCECFDGGTKCECRTLDNVEVSITKPPPPFDDVKKFIQQRPIDAMRLLYTCLGHEKTVRYIETVYPDLFSLSRFMTKQRNKLVFNQKKFVQYATQKNTYNKYLNIMCSFIQNVPNVLVRIIMDYVYIELFSTCEIAKAYYART